MRSGQAAKFSRPLWQTAGLIGRAAVHHYWDSMAQVLQYWSANHEDGIHAHSFIGAAIHYWCVHVQVCCLPSVLQNWQAGEPGRPLNSSALWCIQTNAQTSYVAGHSAPFRNPLHSSCLCLFSACTAPQHSNLKVHQGCTEPLSPPRHPTSPGAGGGQLVLVGAAAAADHCCRSCSC
jgi:hypothetical protein